MGKQFSLLLLVIANIVPVALLLPLATLIDYVRFNPLFNPGYFALAGMVSAQVLILAIFTAFHDPRWSPARWLSISAILFGSFSLLAVEFACTHYLMLWSWGYISGGMDLFLASLYLSIVGASAILAACVAWILLLHIAAWPFRAMLGLRLRKEGEPCDTSSARQFGITHLLAWVGLFAALLWLLTTAAGSPESLYPLVAILGLITLSMVLVLPWIYFLVKEKIKFWPVLVAFLGVTALSYAAEVVTFQFNMFQINGRSAAGVFLMPSFQLLEYGSFTGLAVLTAVLNFFVLRRMGFRFRAAKGVGPVIPHSTTIAPQPSNVMPNVAASS